MTIALLSVELYLPMSQSLKDKRMVLRRLKDRLKAAYLLILPYMIIEALALGYTWASGRSTIFHTAEYSFGMGIVPHFFGHLVGGLTWEPLSVFLIMEIIWLIYMGGRLLTGKKHADA